MTFTEAARIMMSKNPVIEPLTITANGSYTASDGIAGYSPINVAVPTSSGGIWDMIGKYASWDPLAVITLGSSTTVYVVDMSRAVGTFSTISGGYTTEEGSYKIIYAALKYRGEVVAYHVMANSFGYSDVTQYALMSDGSKQQTFRRNVKFGATNVDSCELSKSGDGVSFSLSMRSYLDYFNHSEYHYDDGSVWDEKYAWYNGPFAYSDEFLFAIGGKCSYSLNVLGDTVEEQRITWDLVSADVIGNFNNVFPIISYIRAEDHFPADFYKYKYTNGVEDTNPYNDINVAYMKKWSTPELWT